jgi:hypothetical protein
MVRFQHPGLNGGLVAVIGKEIPAAENEGVEARQGNEFPQGRGADAEEEGSVAGGTAAALLVRKHRAVPVRS